MEKETELFGFYVDPDAIFINANPSGLRKFANELNEIATKWDEDEWSGVVPTENGKHDFRWMQGDVFISAIFEVKDLNEMKSATSAKSTGDWLYKIGCILIIMLFLIPFFAGLQAIYNMIF